MNNSFNNFRECYNLPGLRSFNSQSDTSLFRNKQSSFKNDRHNLHSSNEELFADIERSCNMNVSGESLPTSEEEHSLIDQAIDMFSDTKVILPKQQADIRDVQDQMIKDINHVFVDSCYKSYLSTEIFEPEFLENNQSLKDQFYENNHRRKRKTISDEDSHNFIVRIDGIEGDTRTTVMVKNIPNKYTIQMLKELIDYHHSASYDFLYLPIDFKNKCNMGYAFINFVESRMITSFHNEFHGQKWPHFNSEKICQLRYARIQGRSALLQHFQFSSVMNQKDKKLKPVIVPQNELQRIQQMIQMQKQ
ncbi:unnamed protein product (macronuclear) [Paramecium tetraurelia]|uniref:Mei2-like C-terminal RNA recognition motif domain-containing protein n=1 Tax=Paramecium tetraurelia TaxID=5888 RepID=A0CMH5_PARTE|nr:uncharacterized protein GSPATT00008471001 [Paramecium tetraurelia]CAK71992.1 unnamed protein product [Paramecium tetraurelia]|eukprot:XP_001439389.1 hypothetical protein (macronuclear) [Paramecium tetraurelia strain d4-2]